MHLNCMTHKHNHINQQIYILSPIMVFSIVRKWRQLSGQNNWKKMLHPLDIDLRRCILHYGDMAQATYDSFNSEKVSKYCGSCRYEKADLFSKVGLVNNQPFKKYQITKYLYATSEIPVPDEFIMKSLSGEAWCKESNWIGYVAVATDAGKRLLGRRDIVIAWRGTVQRSEWIKDFEFKLVPAANLLRSPGNPKVHQGWYSIYTSADPQSQYNKSSARNQVLPEVHRLVEKFKNEELSITVTGHSLGASLATLNATDIVANGVHKPKRIGAKPALVTAIAFGCPRVGDYELKHLCSSMKDLRVLRVTNALDLVPTYPLLGYADIGEELRIDTTKSPYVKHPGNVLIWHNLEAYLHGVAGTQGAMRSFKLAVPRDVALVNKTLDGLKEELLVPASWQCVNDKGMVQQKDGSWKLQDHE